jgi:hypothetical protein
LLDENDFVLEVVLGAFVLLGGKGSAQFDQEHHQNLLLGFSGLEDFSHYPCDFAHILLVGHELADVFLHELQQSALLELLHEDGLTEDILDRSQETSH